MISKFALILLIFNNTFVYTYPFYIKLACMIWMITLILPLCCLFNPERHELARGIYIIREVYIAMFVIRIIQLTIAFNHSYHTCKFDIDWISILLKISKINANFDIIAACSSSPSLLLLPFPSCSFLTGPGSNSRPLDLQSASHL